MNSLDILRNAQRLIEKNGLAIGKGRDGKKLCTATALVEGARLNGERFREAPYLEARRIFAVSLGIAPNYQSIVDWNDVFTTEKGAGGQILKHHYRKPQEVVKAFKKAIESARELELAKA